MSEEQPSFFKEESIDPQNGRTRINKRLVFDGDDIDQDRDGPRLTGQLEKIFGLMRDGKARTFKEIHIATGEPENSISAQLRNLRKERFGGHTIDKEYLGSGLYKYWLCLNQQGGEK